MIRSMIEDPKKRLALSLAMGLITALLVWTYLDRFQKKMTQGQTMVTVLMAQKYIAKDKIVTPDLVKEAPIPKAYLEPTAAVSLDDLKNRSGQFQLKARIGLLKGEQITRSKLMEETSYQSLSWSLAPGQVAFSLRLSPERAAGGHIQPGDWVHVLSIMDRQPGWPEVTAQFLLERVQVLAVQEHILNPAVSSEKINLKNMAAEPLSITLSLSPREAALLALAQEKGPVSLALVSPMTEDRVGPLAVQLGHLKRGF